MAENKTGVAQSDQYTPRNEVEVDRCSPCSSNGSFDQLDGEAGAVNATDLKRPAVYLGNTPDFNRMRLNKEAEHSTCGKYENFCSDIVRDQEMEDSFSTYTLNDHLDDFNISVIESIQKYRMPSRQLADRLITDYLETVHPFFPIISKSLLCAQIQNFFDSFARPATLALGDKWIAILNVIFAIAAKHAHLINAPWRGKADDHMMYLTRARLLSMNSESLFEHPSIEQIQVEGLISFYLLASGHVNRLASNYLPFCGTSLIAEAGLGDYQL
jgi:hypothetical protein